jgi:two-component system NtrC family sensor kinase
VVTAALLVAWGATGLGTGTAVVRAILVSHAVFFLLSTWAAKPYFAKHPVPLLLLTGDLLAIGALGCWLHRGLEPQVAFLAGYIVAVLVGFVGRSTTAAVLGTLAGVMVMGLCTTLFAVLERFAPQTALLTYQVLLLGTGSLLSARITGWMDEDMRRQQVNERVERELRTRETEAAQLVSFAQALAAAMTLKDLGEAVLRHLRVHLEVRARAVVLENQGDVIAHWEEDARLAHDDIERRRCLLQECLSRAGSNHAITRLQAHSSGSRVVPPSLDYATAVEVPLRAGGRIAGVLFVGDPHRGKVEDRGIAMLADVARRVGEAVQRIERQGDEQNRRTSLLLRQMREGVLLLAADGTVLLANPAAREALGCPGAEAEIPPQIGDLSLAELARTPAGVLRRFRARLQHKGSNTHVELACTAIGVLDDLKRLGTLVTLSDITEEELARTRLERSEKLTLVGQTLGGVAHELNNPLTALIGYADLLGGRDLPSGVERTLGKIREQALRATRIVKNLLSVARRRNPERKPSSLIDLVESVVELFAYESRLANIEIELDVPKDLPEVLADKHALQQVFINLVQNAIHALKEWEGERRIRINGRSLPDGIVLTVADSGPGIAEEMRTRVFQPFVTTKGPDQGTGLGLALSRSIARDHGGDLILDRDVGGGARFILRLPLPRVLPQTEEDEGRPVRTAVPFHILVVDDEQDVREALVTQLGRLGCRVDSTSTAEEALRLAKTGGYDALLVDIRLQGASGLELHEDLAEKRPDQARRVVFMSGDYTNEELLQSVRETGNRFLEKPFTVEELTEALHAELEPPPTNGANGENGRTHEASRGVSPTNGLTVPRP